MDTTERGEGGGEREDEDRVTLGFKLWVKPKSGSKLWKPKVGPISTLEGKFAQWKHGKKVL